MYTADLSLTDYKVQARAEGISLFRQMTGLRSIPPDSEYWCLCAGQTDSPDSEINQLVREGICTKEQFHGVDYDADLIAANTLTHPEAHWHVGEWTDIIAGPFNPALVYLDTTGTADCISTARLITRTMARCPVNCVLLVNVMLSNPYDGSQCDPELLSQHISDLCTQTELEAWEFSEESFEYSSGRTRMMTVAMRRVK